MSYAVLYDQMLYIPVNVRRETKEKWWQNVKSYDVLIEYDYDRKPIHSKRYVLVIWWAHHPGWEDFITDHFKMTVRIKFHAMNQSRFDSILS